MLCRAVCQNRHKKCPFNGKKSGFEMKEKDMQRQNVRVEPSPSDLGLEQVSGFLPVELILVHANHGTMSFFKTLIPILHRVDKLKRDLADLLCLRPDQQDWYFRGKLLQDSSTLFQCGIKKDDKLTVKEKVLEVEEEEESQNEAIGGPE
ncbi:uncharacterized protein LOC101864419 isoform X2 [Aplysia californica]|uniref:Uncharacterized protein LOC101864419 isoform X2 n=1 Tax=Aplysia californica TaxID=6500 RepID=A0ABM1A9Z9_APLCA|nr:uncharacterized protein LOC101864419 isoform X2 [Aplysia californica]